jgi:hypothetical protein
MDEPPSGNRPRPILSPAASPRAQAERAAREAREAEALRANLRRRKQQARARLGAADDPDAPRPNASPPEDKAG